MIDKATLHRRLVTRRTPRTLRRKCLRRDGGHRVSGNDPGIAWAHAEHGRLGLIERFGDRRRRHRVVRGTEWLLRRVVPHIQAYRSDWREGLHPDARRPEQLPESRVEAGGACRRWRDASGVDEYRPAHILR